jgi:hypothetical protein
VTGRSTFRLAVAEIAAVAINIIPLALWLFDDLSAKAAMLIYAFEALFAVVFAILCVLIISPSYDPEGSPKYKRKGKLIADFSVIAFGFLGVLGVFVGVILFLFLGVDFDLLTIATALAIVLAFQVAEFFVDVATLRPLPLKKAEYLLSNSMGKTAVLFFGVFFGAFLAGFVNEWFVVPLIALKTIIDIGEPIQFFLGKGNNLDASILQTQIKAETRP